jgi:hypothetical protein
MTDGSELRPKYTRDDYEQLREDLTAIIWDEEHSDIPMKTFKIGASRITKDLLSVTIKSRTHLGAVIAFANRDFDMRIDNYRFWHVFAEERHEDDINKYAEEIVERMFVALDDEWLVEIDEEVVIIPFANGTTKSSIKK